jgi:hypothetical protein
MESLADHRQRIFQHQRQLKLPILLLSFALGATLCLKSNASEKTIYGQKVGAGSLLVEVSNGLCLYSGATISAGDFFKGLERVEDEKGLTFRKDKKIVDRFPSELTLEVFVDASRCRSAKEAPLQISEVQGLVDSLQVRAAWKTGAKIRDEAVTSKHRIGTRPSFFVPSFGRLDSGPRANTILWSYVMEVQTNGALLTDHLIVSLVDGNHVLARMAVKL